MSPISAPTHPPPGWYNDPEGAGLRWWDGQHWTEHRWVPSQPQAQPAVIAPPQADAAHDGSASGSVLGSALPIALGLFAVAGATAAWTGGSSINTTAAFWLAVAAAVTSGVLGRRRWKVARSMSQEALALRTIIVLLLAGAVAYGTASLVDQVESESRANAERLQELESGPCSNPSSREELREIAEGRC